MKQPTKVKRPDNGTIVDVGALSGKATTVSEVGRAEEVEVVGASAEDVACALSLLNVRNREKMVENREARTRKLNSTHPVCRVGRT